MIAATPAVHVQLDDVTAHVRTDDQAADVHAGAHVHADGLARVVEGDHTGALILDVL